jgi:hypothetical protein
MEGIVVLADSADFFVQAQDATAAVIATLSATAGASSPQSADISNRLHRGVAFYITVASVTVNTATLAVNILGKNLVDGNYYPVARCSLDGIVTTGQYAMAIAEGMVAAGGGPSQGTNFSQNQGILPAVFAVQASLTVTTTSSMSGTLAYSVRGMSRTL